MPWQSTAISVGGSLLGSALGGGSKAAARAAKDAAARAQYAQEAAMASAKQELNPYTQAGMSASNQLSYLLGTGGYDVAAPTWDDIYTELRNEHFQRFGQDFNRNSNISSVRERATNEYNQRLAEWQKGFDKWKSEQTDPAFGSLNRNFTNADFVKDPGYEFRLLEGERGLNRNGIARGGYDSGAALKELERYRQDYASNEFSNAYNRDAQNKARTYDQLSGVANRGLSASSGAVNAGTNAANNNSNAALGLGSQLSQLATAQANNQSNAYMSALNNLIYGMERNKNSGRIDNYTGYTGGSSSNAYKFYV